jgi:hypothetical protein
MPPSSRPPKQQSRELCWSAGSPLDVAKAHP